MRRLQFFITTVATPHVCFSFHSFHPSLSSILHRPPSSSSFFGTPTPTLLPPARNPFLYTN
jgi:hypothetical protein